jgi:hypothetical protein
MQKSRNLDCFVAKSAPRDDDLADKTLHAKALPDTKSVSWRLSHRLRDTYVYGIKACSKKTRLFKHCPHALSTLAAGCYVLEFQEKVGDQDERRLNPKRKKICQ